MTAISPQILHLTHQMCQALADFPNLWIHQNTLRERSFTATTEDDNSSENLYQRGDEVYALFLKTMGQFNSEFNKQMNGKIHNIGCNKVCIQLEAKDLPTFLKFDFIGPRDRLKELIRPV